MTLAGFSPFTSADLLSGDGATRFASSVYFHAPARRACSKHVRPIFDTKPSCVLIVGHADRFISMRSTSSLPNQMPTAADSYRLLDGMLHIDTYTFPSLLSTL